MTTPGSPVVSLPGFTIPGFGGSSPDTTLIYLTDPAVPERIEAVTFTVDYTDTGPSGEVLAVQLADQASNSLFVQATPPITAPESGSFKVYYCWSRRGNDTSNETTVTSGPYDETLQFLFVNLPLPDIVLGTNSQVNILSWRNTSGEVPDLVVTDGVITRTPNAGAASITSAVNVVPFLVPQG